MGFAADGFTTTNPVLAELTLTQVDPFVIDVAVVEDHSGNRQILMSEQDNRLQLDIGEFTYTRQFDQGRERWYELFSFGATGVYTGNSFMLGPALHIENRRRLDITFGPLWNLDVDNSVMGGQVTLTVRPFRQRRK